MESFYVLLLLIAVMGILGLLEFTAHQRRIRRIPIRIHINGTRGKSSVTRLIGAGLRAGGIPTIAKVTGTSPRLILEDGREIQIYRKTDPNIIEQLSIVKFAAARKVRALVLECMALQPQYQSITENQMIHANVGVITNVRLDHIDVMGRTLPEIAEVLGRTIPADEYLFSAEDEVPEVLRKIADQRHTKAVFVDPESVSEKEMEGFRYFEHRENVALALAVCQHLGIERRTALKGMYDAAPDAGALVRYQIQAFNKLITFYNAFAANDPQSSLRIWHRIKPHFQPDGRRIVLLNTRQDRIYRARQLAELVGRQLNGDIHYALLIGQSTELVKQVAIRRGCPAEKLINLGWATPAAVFEQVLSLTENTSDVIALGNMGGMGAEVVAYFQNRSSHNYD